MTYTRWCRRDPLLRALYGLSKPGIIRIALVPVAVHLLMVLAPGAVISLTYQRMGQPFLSLLDLRELMLAIYSYFFVLPLLWVFYTWQLYGVWRAIHALFRDSIVGRQAGEPSPDGFVDSASKSFNRLLNLGIAAAIPLTFIAVWVATLTPQRTLSFGLPAIWWNVNPVFFWAIFVPHVFVIGYLALWIVIRQVTAILVFRELLRVCTIFPKPFHPDRANGLGPLGRYAIRSALMALPFGFWITLIVVYPVFFGQDIFLSSTHVFLLLAYTLAVPALLIPPVWDAHRAMKKAKAQALEEIAIQLREALAERELGNGRNGIQTLEVLEKRYRLTEQGYRTWPFDVSVMGRFAITAATPLASAVASYILDKVL